jgi:hypothetical protein
LTLLTLRDGAEVADRNPLGEQHLQRRMPVMVIRFGTISHDILDEIARFLGQLLDELLHIPAGQQLGNK